MTYTEVIPGWRFNTSASFSNKGYYWITEKDGEYRVHWKFRASGDLYNKDLILKFINNGIWKLIQQDYEIY